MILLLENVIKVVYRVYKLTHLLYSEMILYPFTFKETVWIKIEQRKRIGPLFRLLFLSSLSYSLIFPHIISLFSIFNSLIFSQYYIFLYLLFSDFPILSTFSIFFFRTSPYYLFLSKFLEICVVPRRQSSYIALRRHVREGEVREIVWETERNIAVTI